MVRTRSGWLLIAIVLIAAVVGVSCRRQLGRTDRTLPRTRVLDAIYERFGDPDRVTDNGGSLHYDLANGQTVTLRVRSGKIIIADVSQVGQTPMQPGIELREQR